MSYEQLRELFDWLNKPNPSPCTHTFLETTQFLSKHSIPTKPALKWLSHNGAGCDCEVIFNVANDWQDTIGWHPIDEDAP